MGYWGVVMQDLACELPRIPIPRNRVNKDKKRKGRHSYAWTLQSIVVKLAPLRALRRCLLSPLFRLPTQFFYLPARLLH